MPDCHRLFFCLRPPARLSRQIGVFRDGLGYAGRPVADERLHVTLGLTVDHPTPLPTVAEAMRTMGPLLEGAPFQLTLDRLAVSNSTVALRPSQTPAELRNLQRQVGRLMSAYGLLKDNWTFHTHMTLLYDSYAPSLRSIPAFIWRVEDVALTHSHVGQSRHVVLGQWPLVRRQMEFAL